MKLQCMCCKVEREFENGEEAFQEGWDAPPYFSTHVVCNLCPSVCVVLRLSHEFAHALWLKEGRPRDFNSRCVPDREWQTKLPVM